MRSTQARSGRCTLAAYAALFVGALALALSLVVLSNAPRDDGDATVRPVESFSSDDLRDAVRELRRLRGQRLTPRERQAVGVAAEALGSIVDGDATIAPATTQPPPPTTTTTTTSTTTTTTTTTTTPSAVPSVADFTNAWLDQLTDTVLP